VLVGHWMLRLLAGSTRALFENVPDLIG